MRLLECSLWPAAAAVGCRAIVALARTRAQKVAMVRAGVLPLLHQHLLFGDALQVRPWAVAAVEALAETIKPLADAKSARAQPAPARDGEDAEEGPVVEGSSSSEEGSVVLSKAEMQVFLAAWSVGSAVLAYGAERHFDDEPHGRVIANPTYRQREAMHSSYDFD
jgi:hypothetical protein